MTSISVVVAVNPTAGGGHGARAGDDVVAILQDGDDPAAPSITAELLIAENALALRERARRALDDGAAALVVVGGDGMVHLGVNLVAGTPTPLGIVAAGTGNDNARELGLPVGDPVAAARVVRDALSCGHRRTVDAARWRDDAGASGWFSGVLSAGFDSIVNERANGWSWPRGRLRYDLAIVRELPVFHARQYTIRLDGERRDTGAVLVAVGNGPAYGGGMRICAGALMDDGLLDVVIAGPMPRRALIRLFPKVFRGEHLSHPAVSLTRARTVRIEAAGIVGYADGERLAPLPMSCEVVPGAIQLLAPPGA